MIKMPVSFKEFSKDPVKAIAFICLIVVGYMYLDNKTVYKDQIAAERIKNEKQEIRIVKLEGKVDILNEKLIECVKNYSSNE